MDETKLLFDGNQGAAKTTAIATVCEAMGLEQGEPALAGKNNVSPQSLINTAIVIFLESAFGRTPSIGFHVSRHGTAFAANMGRLRKNAINFREIPPDIAEPASRSFNHRRSSILWSGPDIAKPGEGK